MSSKKETFESALAQLEEYTKQLQGGSLSLEESADVYNKSVALYKSCMDMLAKAKQKIEIYDPVSGKTEAFEQE